MSTTQAGISLIFKTVFTFVNWFKLCFGLQQMTSLTLIIVLCLKCLFVFLLVVLVRVTVPRFKIETLSKLGWLYSLFFLFLIFSLYLLALHIC